MPLMLRTPTPARRDDPDTSHAAADSIAPFKARALHRWIIAVLVSGPVTDETLSDEHARECAMSWGDDGPPSTSSSGLRTRRSELVHHGLVEDSGLRATMTTGRKAILWRLTPLGRQAHEEGTT